MAGTTPVLFAGPSSYPVSVTVLGGQLVMPDAANPGMIKVADGTGPILGVALTDAQPAGSAPTNPVTTSYPDSVVAVAYGDMDLRVVYNEAVPFGAFVKAVAGGQVGLWNTTASAGRAPTDGVTTSGSPVVTSATGAFTQADVGRSVSGAGIPANTYIAAVNSGTSITMSANATATATAVTITLGAITADAVNLIVGKCTAPLGVAGAGLVGRVRIF